MLSREILLTFSLYFVFMLGIGFYYFKRSQGLSDYILGGRSLNSWVTALSAQASDMSGWLLLGLPGAAYVSGLEAGWIAVGLLIGTYLNWKFIARRFRIYTEKVKDAITIPDYLDNRFDEPKRVLRLLSATFILVFFLIYTASGFVAGATLFTTVFELDYTIALTIGALVVISYTFLGGFLAVCWTDFFQGILMFLAILIVPVSAIILLGGFGGTMDKIQAIDPNLLQLFLDGSGESVAAIGIISSLAWGLGYFGQPHILVRFMGIRHADMIKKSRRIAMVWVTLSLFAAVMVGIVGRAYLGDIENSETIFMQMVAVIFHPLVAGILLAAILAAVMSTADSQLLVTASAISEDFYKVILRPKASDKELLWVSRITVVVVAIIAYIIALNPNNSVMDLTSYAWAGFGATFGPVVILSLYWRRINGYGALAGLIGGGVTTIVWRSLDTGLYEIIPGFIVASLCIVVVSLLTKKPQDSVLEVFDSIH